MSISSVGTSNTAAAAAQAQQAQETAQANTAATTTAATTTTQATGSSGASTFEANAAATSTTAIPAEASAGRSTELTSLMGSPASQKASDVVRVETQVATIVQAAKPEERDAVKAHFETATAEARATAFNAVIEASTTQGTKPVVLGPFTGSVTVDAKGDVNGKPLASDAEVKSAAQLANLTNDDRKAQLKQVGVEEKWLNAASEQQVLSAFNHVEMQRQFGAPGADAISLPEIRQQAGRGMLTIPAAQVNYSVTADRQLTNAAGVTAPASSQAALTRLAETESKEWPGGTPESRLKTRIEDVDLALPKSEKMSTITSVLNEADASKFSSLVNTPPGVTDASFNAAYQSVLDARKSPGEKSIDLSLTPLQTYETYGESGNQLITTEQPPVAFGAKVTVSEDGKINGKTLGVDELAKLSSQISTVPAEAKEAALKEAGLSETWLNSASQQQRDYALAKLRQATGSPGEKSIDLSFDQTITTGGESEQTTTQTIDGKVKLNVGADGKVDGKTPSIEVALATTLTMEKMPMVEKRVMMAQLGIPSEALRTASPQEASDLLSRVALRTKTPGDQQFEAKLGGKDYVVGLKIGAKGEIEGAGAMLKPQPPKQKWYQKWLGPILTIASFVFPVAAPFLQAANAALAIKNGAKGLGLIAAVAGGIAGVGGMIGQFSTVGSSIANTAASVANVANTVQSIAGAANGVYQGIKHGDVLGAFSSVVSLAGNFDGVRNSFGSNFDLLQQAGTVAGYASRVVKGDLAGLVTDIAGNAIRNSNGTTNTTVSAANDDSTAIGTDTESAGSDTDYSLGTAKFGEQSESGTSTVRLGGTASSDDVESTASQGDVRRVDNEIFGKVVRVNAGDNLTRIATANMGDSSRVAELYAWNAAKLGTDPNNIPVGVDLEMPPDFFQLTQAERNLFHRTTHIPAATTTTISTSTSTDNRDARDIRYGSGNTTTGSSSPTITPDDPYLERPPGERADELLPRDSMKIDLPAFLMGAKIKAEFKAGKFKGELSAGPESGFSFKGTSTDSIFTREMQLAFGPVKFTAEPSISVNTATGAFQLEGKVQGQTGPVAIAIKGQIDAYGNYKIDVPTVSMEQSWLSAGLKAFGNGVTIKIETGPLITRGTGNTASNWTGEKLP